MFEVSYPATLIMSSHQAPSASTRLVRLEGPALAIARCLADISAAGCRPQVTGVPTTPGRIALLIWCSLPNDIIPVIRTARAYTAISLMFGPLTALPEWDQPATVLVTGRSLWRWLCKVVQKAVA